VAVLVGIAAVSMFDLTEEGVKVIGVLPEGLPSLAIPTVELADLGALFSGALGIALVAVADTTVLSRALAAQRDETVDPNQELCALGVANLAAGLFQGFSISSSASRTPVAVEAGARSQLTPLVAFAGVALLGVLLGIFVAILLSLADFVRRAWRPYDAVLGREDDLKGYHDIDRHPSARRIPGLVLYRFDAPCSSPTSATSAAASTTWSTRPPAPSAGWWSPPSPSPTSTPAPPTPSASSSPSSANGRSRWPSRR
jgi:MFS superfamily sulfate permease-like transporter